MNSYRTLGDEIGNDVRPCWVHDASLVVVSVGVGVADGVALDGDGGGVADFVD